MTPIQTQPSNDALYDWTVGGDAKWCGPVAALLGYSPGDVRPSLDWWQSALHADDAERVIASLEDALTGTGGSWSATYRMRRADGSYVALLDRAQIFRDAGGNAVRMVGWIIDLSDRLSIDARLSEQEGRYKALFLQSLDAIVVTDLDGTIAEANPAALEMFGVTRETLGEFRANDAYVNDADRVELLRSMQTHGIVQRFELRLRRSNGEVFLATYSGSLRRDGQGRPVGHTGVLRDITAAREAEERVRSSEQRLNQILQTSTGGLVIVGATGRIEYANPAAEHILGLASDVTMIGRVYDDPQWKITAVDGGPIAPEELPFSRVMRTGRPVMGVEHAIEWPDGTRVVLSINGAPLTNASGQVTGMVASLHDITERLRVEIELRARERELQAVLDRFTAIIGNADEIVALLDADGVIRYVTPSVSRLGNITVEDTMGRPFLSFMHSDDRPMLEGAFNRVRGAADASETVGPYRVVLPDGKTLWGEARFSNMLDHPALGAVVMHSRDITERVNAESARTRAEDQFRQSQKMEAIGRLAGGVAHDFNNLLTAITGSAELALANASDDEMKTDLETIRSAAYKAAAITSQLLAFSRKQMTSPRVVDVNNAVQSFESLLRRLVSPDVTVELVLESRRAIEVDPVQLEQALLNLAVNANDAMSGDGQLTIRTLDRASTAQTVIEVVDTGPGIEEAIRARIFEPFFTTKAPGQGTGLGLATVYGIVQQAGGRVELDTAPGSGSTFRLVFPASEGSVMATGEHHIASSRISGSETILVVDDEASVRLPVCKALRRFGYKVIEAKHGKDAITLLAERARPVDLVITDLVMPEMGGAELIAELRASDPSLPVVFISGYSRDVGKARGAAQDAPFLQKPFAMESLVRAVRETIDRARTQLARVA